MNQQIKKGDCISIFAKRGSGKSFLARKIIKSFKKNIIIDPVFDDEWKKEFPQSKIANNFDLFCEYLIRENKNNNYSLIYRPDPDQKDHDLVINEIARLAFISGDVNLTIDEIQLFTSPAAMPHHLKNAYTIGRHKGLSVTAITQSPSQVNKMIMKQSNHIFCGQLFEKNDLESVKSFLGKNIDTLLDLMPREFIHFSPNEKDITRFSTEIKSKKINKK